MFVSQVSVFRVERFGLPGCNESTLYTRFTSSLLMLVVALNREAGVNPVLLTLGVVTHIGVTHGRQFTGGVL
jgi:hypothetical protein